MSTWKHVWVIRWMFLFAILFPSIASAQAPQLNVFVEHIVGDDAAGQSFANGFKEALRQSSGYSLAESLSSAEFVVVLLSVGDSSGPRPFSAISISYIVNNDAQSFMTASVRITHREVAEKFGRELVAELDSVVNDYRRYGRAF